MFNENNNTSNTNTNNNFDNAYQPPHVVYPRSLHSLPGITPGYIEIYETIYQFWNRDLPCYLSLKTIAKRTGYSKQYVCRALNYFESHGKLIRREVEGVRYLVQPEKAIPLAMSVNKKESTIDEVVNCSLLGGSTGVDTNKRNINKKKDNKKNKYIVDFDKSTTSTDFSTLLSLLAKTPHVPLEIESFAEIVEEDEHEQEDEFEVFDCLAEPPIQSQLCPQEINAPLAAPAPEIKQESTQSKKAQPPVKDYKKDALFMQFYNSYPNKQKPFVAYRAFRKLKPTQELVNFLVDDIEKRKKGTWAGRALNFISHPASYLNGREYEGEIQEASMENKEAIHNEGRASIGVYNPQWSEL